MPQAIDLPTGVLALIMRTGKFTTRALSSSTAAVGELAGAAVVVMLNSANNPGTYTTRTAALMTADHDLINGQQWLLLLGNNQGTGVLTLAGGTNVTISGTATVATTTGRLYQAAVAADGTITFTNVCAWTIAA